MFTRACLLISTMCLSFSVGHALAKRHEQGETGMSAQFRSSEIELARYVFVANCDVSALVWPTFVTAPVDFACAFCVDLQLLRSEQLGAGRASDYSLSSYLFCSVACLCASACELSAGKRQSAPALLLCCLQEKHAPDCALLAARLPLRNGAGSPSFSPPHKQAAAFRRLTGSKLPFKRRQRATFFSRSFKERLPLN